MSEVARVPLPDHTEIFPVLVENPACLGAEGQARRELSGVEEAQGKVWMTLATFSTEHKIFDYPVKNIRIFDTKDCAIAVHVIQDDRRVASVKFDSVAGGFVRRGSATRKVYGAVEEYIEKHGEIFRNPVAEVGE